MALLIELDGDIGRFDNYKQVDAYLWLAWIDINH